MDKNDILTIIDGCMAERIESLDERPRSADVRKLSLTCQQVLYEVYHEPRANGSMGEAEDILRNDNIKAAITQLPEPMHQLAREVLACAHARLHASGQAG